MAFRDNYAALRTRLELTERELQDAKLKVENAQQAEAEIASLKKEILEVQTANANERRQLSALTQRLAKLEGVELRPTGSPLPKHFLRVLGSIAAIVVGVCLMLVAVRTRDAEPASAQTSATKVFVSSDDIKHQEPTKSEIIRAMSAFKEEVSLCGGAAESLSVAAEFRGSTGVLARIKSARLSTGELATDPTLQCVRRAVENNVKVQPFNKPWFTVKYPFRLAQATR